MNILMKKLTTLKQFKSPGGFKRIFNFPLGTGGGSQGVSSISSINFLGIFNLFMR